jgi:Fe2+ or Zn2+ uptake regulation protein
VSFNKKLIMAIATIFFTVLYMSKSNKRLCGGEPQSYIELCSERLRESGGRISGARLLVISCLAEAEKPLVAKDILERIQRSSKSAGVDLASVYRNLEALQSKGLAHQVGHSGGYFPCLHSSCGDKIHVLIRCESCQETKELHAPSELIEMLTSFVFKASKAMSQISTFQIEGLCRSCK